MMAGRQAVRSVTVLRKKDMIKGDQGIYSRYEIET